MMIKITRLIAVTVFFLTFSYAEAFPQSASAFFADADTFFGRYVANGKVDYKAIYNNPEELNMLLKKAKTLKIPASDAKNYQAFWINAYNLAVIKGIIDHYPTTSPLNHKGFFDTITYELGGVTITLNDIENKNLRARFNDARFHFVLVCGARGCPPLISRAYKPSALEVQLEQQTKKALNNPKFIRVTDGAVAFSEIFKWYKEDFVKNGKTEIDFLNRYRNEKVPASAKVTYYTYDWRLNTNNEQHITKRLKI